MKPNLDKLLELDFLRDDQIRDFKKKDRSTRAFQILLFTSNNLTQKQIDGQGEEFNRELKKFLQAQIFLVTTKISIKDYFDFKQGLSPYGPLNLMPQTIHNRKRMEAEGLGDLDKVYNYIVGCPLSRLYDEWVIVSDGQE